MGGTMEHMVEPAIEGTRQSIMPQMQVVAAVKLGITLHADCAPVVTVYVAGGDEGCRVFGQVQVLLARLLGLDNHQQEDACFERHHVEQQTPPPITGEHRWWIQNKENMW